MRCYCDSARRVGELEHLVDLMAGHLGVDLDTLQTIEGLSFRKGIVIDWKAEQAAIELEELEAYLERGEPMPAACDNRARTLRRWLAARTRDRVAA